VEGGITNTPYRLAWAGGMVGERTRKQRRREMATATINSESRAAKPAAHIDSREDLQLRDKLDQVGIQYECVTVLMSSVDIESNEYQTRQHSIVDVETVDRYVMAIQAGDSVFPEMLLAVTPGARKSAAKQLKCVGGRHRAVAHIKAGITSTTAIVAYPKTETDKAKLLTLSRWDNLRNGKPESLHAHYLGLAQECIAAAGGYSCGMPTRDVITDIASRNNLTASHKQRLKKYIRALMFQAECRALGISRVPESIALCDEAAAFLDNERFDAIAKTICANQHHKRLSGIIKECAQRKLRGEKAVEFLRDQSSGFTEPVERMKSSDQVRLRCKALSDSVVKLEGDASLTCADIEKLERSVEEAMDVCFAVTSRIKERACNG
jgi:hypothetical protein